MTYRDWPLVRLLFNSFSNVPGPLVAKVSRLWKLYHLLRGDLSAAIRRLHERHGPLVQIAPYEYSLSDKSLVYIPNLRHTSSIVLPPQQNNLERALRMANLYSAERQIDSCNESLVTLIKMASDKGENIDMTELLTRYAHEVMLACTVGQRAGFLEHDDTGLRLDKGVLTNWKFYAILHGSYLRYHPFIASILKRWRILGGSSAQLMLKLMPPRLSGILGSQAGFGSKNSPAELETCIALTLAAADPTVSLILTALHYIYSYPGLLEELRAETLAAQCPPRPTFKQLILARPSMSKLHAVLLECTRLHPPYITGPEYVSSKGEVDGDQKIPPGSTIALEPIMIHGNPGCFGDESNVFNPMRFLDASKRPELQRLFLAFNISDINNIETAQILMASKIVVEFLSSWSLKRTSDTESIYKPFSIHDFYQAQRIPFLVETLGEPPHIQATLIEAASVGGSFTSSIDVDSTDSGAEDTATVCESENTVNDTTIISALSLTPSNDAHNITMRSAPAAPSSEDGIATAPVPIPATSTDHTLLNSSTSAPGTSSYDGGHVAAAPSNAEVSSAASTTSSSRRGSGSSKASFSSAGDRTIVSLPAANQLATILGEDDANELMNGRFAPHLKNFIGAKAIYTKPVPDAYHRRLVHKALDETHGRRLAHHNNPDTNIMAIGLQNSIPRGYGRPRQQSGYAHKNKRPQYNNNNDNHSDSRGGAGNQSSTRGRNPSPRTTTNRRPPVGGFDTKWNNYATAEGERADYWKTDEGYAERQATMAAQDAAIEAAGGDAEAQPRFRTTFRQTAGETVDGRLGGVRKAVNIEKY